MKFYDSLLFLCLLLGEQSKVSDNPFVFTESGIPLTKRQKLKEISEIKLWQIQVKTKMDASFLTGRASILFNSASACRAYSL